MFVASIAVDQFHYRMLYMDLDLNTMFDFLSFCLYRHFFAACASLSFFALVSTNRLRWAKGGQLRNRKWLEFWLNYLDLLWFRYRNLDHYNRSLESHFANCSHCQSSLYFYCNEIVPRSTSESIPSFDNIHHFSRLRNCSTI